VDAAWLLSLAVTAQARGKGVSTALLDSLISALKDTPATRLKLTVDPNHEDAAGFYRAKGFGEAGFEEDYFGPGKPRVVLELQL
jgi:ribosomal-protein-alanine N-acetyltransferase